MKEIVYFLTRKATTKEESGVYSDNEDVDLYLQIGRRLSAGVNADRTRLVESILPIRVKHTIGIAALHSSISFADAADYRATEIIQNLEKEDKEIYLMWSGGIDSTTMLAALLKNSNLAQRQRFNILLSDHSIIENKDFFFNHIIGKLKYSSSRNIYNSLKDKTVILMSADCSDQLVGGPYNIYPAEFWQQPPTLENLSKIYNNKYSETLFTDRLMPVADAWNEIHVKTATTCNVELKTILQWWRWNTINFVFTRKFYQFYEFGKGKFTIDTFYRSSKLDQWALGDLVAAPGQPKIYKYDLKKYIFDFDHNEDYFINKQKKGSAPAIAKTNIKRCLIDEDFNTLDPKHFMDYYQQNNFITQALNI